VTDYYELLKIDRTASQQEILARLREEQRTWQRQTGHPDLDRRQLAEQRMRDLAEAKKTLTDSGRRADYDRRLAQSPDHQPADRAGHGGVGGRAADRPEAAGSPADGWLDQAWEALDTEDYLTAWHAAREARDAGEDSAEVWLVQGRASLGQDRAEQAVFELRQSLSRERDRVQTHYWLGRAHEGLGQWDDALVCYEDVERLAPGEGAFFIASAHVECERPELAVPLLEDLLSGSPDDEAVRHNLALALTMQAEAVPRVQKGSSHVITAPDEIQRMRPLLLRALALSTDPEQRAGITAGLSYVEWCDAYHFRNRGWFSCGSVSAVGVLLVVLFIISPELMVLLLVALAVLAFFGSRERGWRTNARGGPW
jgi:tetratricopeptide (TPR) repeat protein